MALPGFESLPPALPVRSRYGVELRNAPLCEAELRTRRRNKWLIPNWNRYDSPFGRMQRIRVPEGWQKTFELEGILSFFTSSWNRPKNSARHTARPAAKLPAL